MGLNEEEGGGKRAEVVRGDGGRVGGGWDQPGLGLDLLVGMVLGTEME